MEPCLLTDPNTKPYNEAVFAEIGRSASLWEALFEKTRTEFTTVTEEWNYYRDTKCWLMKVTTKKKTIMWVSIIKGAFRCTFFFPERFLDQLLALPISDEVKLSIRDGKRVGKSIAIALIINKRKQLNDVHELFRMKVSLNG